VALSVAGPAHAAGPYADTDYVALGDSYSAGVGAPGQSGLCLRGSRGFPALWATRNNPRSYALLACNGATTNEVRWFQIPLLSRSADLVTITVGGNDAGFVPAVVTCTLGSDRDCADAVTTATRSITGPLPARLDATYAAIRARAPRARVVVLSYPRLFEVSVTGCGPGGLSQAKRRSLNAGADALDRVVQARATAAGFAFADVRDAFDAHGVCGGAPWLNGLTVPPTDSFHPNADGYARGYLPALDNALTPA
jgi:lysophospholipase L1-like esterase